MVIDAAEARILYGSEHETGVRVKYPDRKGLEDMATTTVNLMVDAPLPDGLVGLQRNPDERLTRRYLSNGGLLYNDHDHVEIATAEHIDVEDFVANELYNERIVLFLIQKLVDAGIIEKGVFDARVIDQDGKSWGYHLNFLLERAFFDLSKRDEIATSPIAQHFALFLASWGMITGSGGIGRSLDGKGHQLYVHTKASTLTGEVFSVSTTGPKPLFNTRDEPLADKEKYTRLHVVTPDYSPSPWSKRMSVLMPTMVLKALMLGYRLEENFDFGELTLVDVARVVAADPTCREEVELADGRRIRPLEIQRAFLKLAQKVRRHRDITESERWVLAQWEMALDRLEVDPFTLKEASWPGKVEKLQLLYDREGSWSSQKMLVYDRILDRLGPGTRNDDLRAQSPWSKHMPPPEKVGPFTPPTRAKLREKFIRKLVGKTWLDPNVYWEGMSTYNEATRRRTSFRIMDPYVTTHEGLEEYLATL